MNLTVTQSADDRQEGASPESFSLVPVEGPEMEAVRLPEGRSWTLGRASACDSPLRHESVSRRHASIVVRSGNAVATDHGSRCGTFLNGVRLAAEQAAPLKEGDLLRIAPWTFLVTRAGGGRRAVTTLDQSVGPLERVDRVSPQELAHLAQQRLSLLIEYAAAINASTDEKGLAEKVVDAAVAGTGFTRAAIIRPLGTGDEVEVIARRAAPGVGEEALSFSRSLLRAAAGGEMSRLTTDSDIRQAVSIVQLGISAALCAPIVLGGGVAAYLYLDARKQERPVHADAAAYCQAITRMAGLALANLKRVELEARQRQMEADLQAAREAQEMIVPRASGSVGRFRYAMRMKPGRTVAGDLFDVVNLEDGSAGVFIGDVTGEGIGAAILMATVQAHLHASLLRHGDPAAALDQVNRYLSPRVEMRKMVTMMAAVIDGARGEMRYVDAGHGHWLHIPRGGTPAPVRSLGGPPLGVAADRNYKSERLALTPGDRVVLYSDGLVEQSSGRGDRFEQARVIQALAGSESCEDDVGRLLSAIEKFAGGNAQTDDTTIASIEIA